MALSGISYSGVAGGLTIQALTGTIPGTAFETMSSVPYVLQPASFFNVQKTYTIIAADFYGGYASTSSPFDFGLTFDQAIYPFFEFNWKNAGLNLVSCATNVPLNFGAVFYENNLNGAPFANLVIKSIANFPGTDYFECKYRILFIEQDLI